MTRVSPSPSQIPYGGFSPVRLQTDCRRRPSPWAPVGSMQSTSPGAAAFYAATAQALLARGPCGRPVGEPCGPIGTNANDRGTSVQRPWARQRVRLSRRVHAYYGLIRASGSPGPVAHHRLLAPEELLWAGRARRSPIDSAWRSDHAASPTPVARGVRVVVASAAAVAFASGVRARRPHQVVSRLQSSLDATAWSIASPPHEDVYTRACARRVAPHGRRVGLRGQTTSSHDRTSTG
jgi:hypothetical protein